MAGRGSKARDLNENGGIHLLQGIIKIKEIGRKWFEMIFNCSQLLTCHRTVGFVVFFFPQTPLAPPEVQQQYLSSIQHLLGDGMVLIMS